MLGSSAWEIVSVTNVGQLLPRNTNYQTGSKDLTLPGACQQKHR